MYNQKLRDNKARFDAPAMGAIYNAFERALIWQAEELEEHQDRALTYGARFMCEQTCNIFMSMVFMSDKATKQAIAHQAGNVGHDLALQMLGHGVGFWEQTSTTELHTILDFLLDMKAIKPFTLYFEESFEKLEFDYS